MKQFLSCLFFALSLFIFGCGERVQPDEEGVLITNYGKNFPDDYQSVSGKVTNVSNFTVTGRMLVTVPMGETRVDLDPFTVIAKDGGEFTVDPAFAFRPERGKGPYIVYKFFQDKSNEQFLFAIAQRVLNVRVQDKYKTIAGSYSSDSLMNNRVAFEKQVEDSVEKEFQNSYFVLEQLSSNLIPPKSIRESVERRNAATQRTLQIQNELAQAQAQQEIAISNAEAQLKVSEIEAKQRQLMERSLTPQILQYEFILMLREKWNGNLHQTPIPLLYQQGVTK